MISNDIRLFTAKADEIEINKREAYRYMGVKHISINEDFDAIYDSCIEIFNKEVNYKAVIAPINISFGNKNQINLDFCTVNSFHLKRNLSEMNKGYIFAATLGVAVDRIIYKYSRLEPSKAMVLDSIASSAIECFCDKLNNEYKANYFSRHRFSPGYGDLSLDVQPKILEYLDAYRKIGISLSENYFMTPSKSVTAIFGIQDKYECNRIN